MSEQEVYNVSGYFNNSGSHSTVLHSVGERNKCDLKLKYLGTSSARVRWLPEIVELEQSSKIVGCLFGYMGFLIEIMFDMTGRTLKMGQSVNEMENTRDG